VAATSEKRKQHHQEYCLTKVSAAVKGRYRDIREKNLEHTTITGDNYEATL
jgi:hypothetical protein